MNLNTENKTKTLLFNPFYYVAGAQALWIGLGMILLAAVLGALGKTHFDGVLDTHSGMDAPFWVFLAEGIIDWLCLGAVLLVCGLLFSKTSFRAVDVLGTQALARWPSLLIALLMLPEPVRRFSAQLRAGVGAGNKPALDSPDAIVFWVIVVASLPLLCWMVYLMYKAYSFSCNIKGAKAIWSFIGGLIVAEAVSKVCLGLVIFPMLGDTAPKASAPSKGSGAIQSPAASVKSKVASIASAGEEFVDLLAREDYAGAVAQFDSKMTEALPEPKLREAWQAVVKEAGPFGKRLKTRTTNQEGYQIALVTCQFERAALDVRVVFDSDRRVAGLFFVPSESK